MNFLKDDKVIAKFDSLKKDSFGNLYYEKGEVFEVVRGGIDSILICDERGKKFITTFNIDDFEKIE